MSQSPPNPQPVTGPVTDTQLRATAVPVSLATAPTTAITAAALPLPSGASTSANQATELTDLGAVTETAPATDTASSGLNGRLQRIAQRLTSIIALLPAALGSGGGLKVDGSGTALPVSGTVTANAGTNLNTSALALDATVGTTNTEVGGLTETAPASDTASSGLNGRLQRIAQRLTTVIGLLPTALGAGGGLKVDGSGTALPTSAVQSGTWTVQPGNTANTTPWMVGGKKVTIAATLTRPNDTTAYAAGDSVSSSTSAPTVMTFTGCARATGGSGTIVRALMSDSAYSATPGSFELWLLDTTTTTPTNDNAAFAPADADVNAVVAIIPFSAVYNGTATAGTGGNMLYQAVGPYPFVTVGSANLFGIIVVRTAYTPIAVEAWVVRLVVEQD